MSTKLAEVQRLLEAVIDRIPAEGVGPSAWCYIAGLREREPHGAPPILPKDAQVEPERYVTPNSLSAIGTPVLRKMLKAGLVRCPKPGKYAKTP